MQASRFVTVAVLAGVVGISAQAHAGQGNGGPNGAHYNLNIIGHTTCSGDDQTGSNTHVIQVLLRGGDQADWLNGQLATDISKKNKIYLEQSFDGSFQVLDGNACDDDGARFKLPAPGSYDIWARALGKPGGSATMTSCATGAGEDGELGTADDEIVCSTENVLLVRDKGRSSFTNVTTELTTITADLDGDGNYETYELFDADMYDYFWNFENRGLRLAQLRFYPLP